jgi:ribosomal-protein-alanine N-acetyltransferase
MMLPTIETARLTLVPFSLDDVDGLHQFWTDPDVRRYLWDDVVISRDRAEETVRTSIESADRSGAGLWLMRSKAADELIGFCGLILRVGEEAPELMFGIARPWWGRGLATEASLAAVEYAFKVLGAARVTAVTDSPNVASVRVMERLGMRRVHRGIVNGADSVVYELRREDVA